MNKNRLTIAGHKLFKENNDEFHTYQLKTG